MATGRILKNSFLTHIHGTSGGTVTGQTTQTTQEPVPVRFCSTQTMETLTKRGLDAPHLTRALLDPR